MATGGEPGFDPEQFSGRVPLFPLPSLVMFPHVVQPLHIFEPRYRLMLEHALAGDRLIAMAVLAPGWEADYEGRPNVRPMTCVGQVTSHHRLEDGRYNLLLAGLRRGRIVRELPPDRAYREALVEVCEDWYPPENADFRPALQRQLLDRFREALVDFPKIHEQLVTILAEELPLGVLTDVMAFTLRLEQQTKERLLDELDVDNRAQILLESLPHLDADDGQPLFPPDFSEN